MAHKIEVIGANLVITNLLNGEIKERPKKDYFFNDIELREKQRVEFYDTNNVSITDGVLFSELLTECQNDLGVTFTDETFREFMRVDYLIDAVDKVNATSFFVNVNEGLIDGVTAFDKFGRNDDIDTGGTPEDIWNGGGLYTGFPTETETLEIFSNNANDNGTGTGARTVEISNLLDENFNKMPNITVTLNGITPVSLGAGLYHRTNRARVMTAGSEGYNIGAITIRHTTTVSNVFAIMPPEHNQTQIFAFTVPANHTLYIPTFSLRMSRLNGSAGSANVRVKMKDGVSNVWRVVRNIEITDSQSYVFNSDTYFVMPEKTDVRATVETVSDNNTTVTGEADGFTVNNLV